MSNFTPYIENSCFWNTADFRRFYQVWRLNGSQSLRWICYQGTFRTFEMFPKHINDYSLNGLKSNPERLTISKTRCELIVPAQNPLKSHSPKWEHITFGVTRSSPQLEHAIGIFPISKRRQLDATNSEDVAQFANGYWKSFISPALLVLSENATCSTAWCRVAVFFAGSKNELFCNARWVFAILGWKRRQHMFHARLGCVTDASEQCT